MAYTIEVDHVECSIESLKKMMTQKDDPSQDLYRKKWAKYAPTIITLLEDGYKNLAQKLFDRFNPNNKFSEIANLEPVIERGDRPVKMLLSKIYVRSRRKIVLLGLPSDMESVCYLWSKAYFVAPLGEYWEAMPLLVLPEDTHQKALGEPWRHGVFPVELDRDWTHPDLLEYFERHQETWSPNHRLFCPFLDERGWKNSLDEQDYLMQF